MKPLGSQLPVAPADSLDSSADVQRREADYVATESVRVFMESLPGGLGAGLLGAVVLAWILQQVGARDGVAPWLATQTVLLGIAMAAYLHYRGERDDALAVRAWGRRFVVIAMVLALGWGSAAFYFLPGPASVELVTILGASVIVIGGIGHMAAYLPVYFSFLVAAEAPFALALARVGDTAHLAMSVGVVGMMLGLPVFAVQTHRSIRRSLLLAFRNRELAGALAQRNRDIETAHLAKSRFLAAASHDLRQPVHALGLLIDVLHGQGLNEAQRATVQQLKLSVAALEDLFNGLLDISRLDASVVTVHAQDIALAPVLGDIAREFSGDARAQGLELRVRCAPLTVRSDALLLGRVLRNLLSNALRYTVSGGVLLACRRRASGVVIEVWDTGIGIAPDAQAAVFDEFYQCGNPERDRNQGLGLGLAIVRRLLSLLGHPLELRSAPGRGSVFRVCLPAVTGAPVAHAPGNAPRVSGKPLAARFVVLIDDDRLVREAMARLLRDWQCEVAACRDFEELVAQAVDWSRAPDLVVSDLRLRGTHNGEAVIAWLREEFNDERLPAVIVTGDVVMRSSLALPGVTVLHKPVAPAVLEQAMRALLAARSASDCSVATAPSC